MSPSQRYLTWFVILGVFVTQTLFVYGSESNYWNDRRKIVRNMTNNGLSSSVQPIYDSLHVSQWPTAEKVVLSSSVAKSLPSALPQECFKLLKSLSPAHGSIRKISLGKRGGPVILHIQDVHMNREAQWNIKKAVSSMLETGLVDFLVLEGSTEEIPLQPFVDFLNRKAVELTADYMLNGNMISGPIHAAMTARGKLPRILGIDDQKHYEANVRAYKESAPLRELACRRMAIQKNGLAAKKEKVYSSPLKTFDQIVQNYRSGALTMGDYIFSFPGQSLSHQALLFQKALRLEKELDFKQVEYERAQLVDRLVKRLSKEQTQTLLAQTIRYRSGHLCYAEFYQELINLCRTVDIGLSDYPSIGNYVKYVILADGIDSEKLMEELEALEKKTYKALAKTAVEKKLVGEDRRLWLIGKLTDYALTPTEWGELRDHFNRSGRMGNGGLDDALSLNRFQSFYREATARDEAMATNVLATMKTNTSRPNRPTTFVLVTGGFHAPGLTRSLTEAGATVISFVPKIEKVDTAKGPAYLSVFTQEKTPLEKLFEGEKLYLAPNPISPLVRWKAAVWTMARLFWLEKSGMTEEFIKNTSLGREMNMDPRWKNFKLSIEKGDVVAHFGNGNFVAIDGDGNYEEKTLPKISWTKPLNEVHKTIALLFGQKSIDRFIARQGVIEPAHLAKLIVGIQWIKRATWTGILLTPILSFLCGPWSLMVLILVHLAPHYIHNILFPESSLMGRPDGTLKKGAHLRSWFNFIHTQKRALLLSIFLGLGGGASAQNIIPEKSSQQIVIPTRPSFESVTSIFDGQAMSLGLGGTPSSLVNRKKSSARSKTRKQKIKKQHSPKAINDFNVFLRVCESDAGFMSLLFPKKENVEFAALGMEIPPAQNHFVNLVKSMDDDVYRREMAALAKNKVNDPKLKTPQRKLIKLLMALVHDSRVSIILLIPHSLERNTVRHLKSTLGNIQPTKRFIRYAVMGPGNLREQIGKLSPHVKNLTTKKSITNFSKGPTIIVSVGERNITTEGSVMSEWLSDKRAAVRSHMNEFVDGASFLIPQNLFFDLILSGSPIGRDDGVYVVPDLDMDNIVKEAGGDLRKIESRLGIPERKWNGPLVRVFVRNPGTNGVRLPNGLGFGANEFFIWGGFTIGGVKEAVTEKIPLESVLATNLEFELSPRNILGAAGGTRRIHRAVGLSDKPFLLGFSEGALSVLMAGAMAAIPLLLATATGFLFPQLGTDLTWAQFVPIAILSAGGTALANQILRAVLISWHKNTGVVGIDGTLDFSMNAVRRATSIAMSSVKIGGVAGPALLLIGSLNLFSISFLLMMAGLFVAGGALVHGIINGREEREALYQRKAAFQSALVGKKAEEGQMIIHTYDVSTLLDPTVSRIKKLIFAGTLLLEWKLFKKNPTHRFAFISTQRSLNHENVWSTFQQIPGSTVLLPADLRRELRISVIPEEGETKVLLVKALIPFGIDQQMIHSAVHRIAADQNLINTGGISPNNIVFIDPLKRLERLIFQALETLLATKMSA